MCQSPKAKNRDIKFLIKFGSSDDSDIVGNVCTLCTPYRLST